MTRTPIWSVISRIGSANNGSPSGPRRAALAAKEATLLVRPVTLR